MTEYPVSLYDLEALLKMVAAKAIHFEYAVWTAEEILKEGVEAFIARVAKPGVSDDR